MKRIEKLWIPIIQSIIITVIITFSTFLGLSFFGHKEKVRCDIMIHPDVNYLRTEWNFTNTTINLVLSQYSKPYYANLTFDNFHEALSYKQLWIDGQKHPEWYTPTLECDPNKVQLPIEPKDFVNKP